ncbi:MAG: LysR family transcriptional regulator, partial [Treponema sp.]|nr:LysR family transcriptional regulator [Treponema sp.]
TKNVKLLKIANTNCTRDILVTYKNNKTDDQKTRKFYTFLIDFIEKEKKATETYSPQQNS